MHEEGKWAVDTLYYACRAMREGILHSDTEKRERLGRKTRARGLSLQLRACRSTCPEQALRAAHTRSEFTQTAPHHTQKTYLETLACSDADDELLHLAAFLDRSAVHDLPVVEHGLGERLSASMCSELSVETE